MIGFVKQIEIAKANVAKWPKWMQNTAVVASATLPYEPPMMTGYKLFRKRKDGTYGPLFINRKQRLVKGETYDAEAHPTKGYAYRPHWHICSKPVAPHLSTKNGRVWCHVSFRHAATLNRPAHQGGVWYLGDTLRILEECNA